MREEPKIGLPPPARRPAQAPPHAPQHELVRCIGKDGYGQVWLARNVIGQWRAVKVVSRRADDVDQRAYEREYAGIREYGPISLSHPSLVKVFQVGRNEKEGYFYYVMELKDFD